MLRKSLTSLKTPSGGGEMRVASLASAHQEAIVSMVSKPSLHPSSPTVSQTTSNVSVIAGSPPSVRKTTCKGKSLTCNRSSQTTRSSQTLDPESISRGEASGPFWSSQAKELSPKLWLPTETASAASLSNSWNGSFTSMESNSWFSIKTWTPLSSQNLQKTSFPSFKYSIAECKEEESTPKGLYKVSMV